jgi:hypothetical protein
LSPTPSGNAPAVRIADPAGPYRRRIRLAALDPHTVWGGLEDDFHHFQVTLRHDGTRVTQVDMHAVRWPWRTCPDAGARLHELEGMALSHRSTAVASVSDPKWACTHQFDLAGLCVAHAARGTGERRYDVELPPEVDGTTTPRLWRDGVLLLEWELGPVGGEWRGIVSPPSFAEAPWRGGFMRWADATLPPEEAEAAIVLRRACDIGMGRGMDLEAYDCAIGLAEIMTGVCYSMQPEIMPVAFRNRGSIRDFAAHPDALLRGQPERDAGAETDTRAV